MLTTFLADLSMTNDHYLVKLFTVFLDIHPQSEIGVFYALSILEC